MKTFRLIGFIILAAVTSGAQSLKSPPSGGNKKAVVGEQVGITDITIRYDRPGVKGREGKIYGTQVVHTGYTDLGLNGGRLSPWRAGANENTTMEFSTDVKIEGQALPAGKYGFFIAYDPNECTLIFSKNSTSWGSYYYDDKEDALRVKVKPITAERSVEWLKYEFMNQSDNSATIALQWEKTVIPFKVEVDLVQTSLADFRLELRGDKGFTWQACEQAASFCLANRTNLDEGLTWGKNAVLYGANFTTLSTYASLLDLKGQKQKADSVMNQALLAGSMMDLHFYGRKLLSENKKKEALDVFQMNAKKNPKQFTTYAGLARGYSANGDYKSALANAKMALPVAPNDINKKSVEGMIQKLENGKDIN